ncbi:MAG: S41 family peptidase [Myxococcota bacterium]|nr:S41 family peptidase [Myxococcota bacterium]
MHLYFYAAIFIVLFLTTACTSGPERHQPDSKAPVPMVPLSDANQAAAGTELSGTQEALGGYPRYPDHHSGVVVFSAEGDLWQVSITGGIARRLTTSAGDELFARFSPDGSHLAFSGDYDGNQDVYVMPAAGGVPHRLTFHPSPDQVLGWTPDGKAILFRSRRFNPHGDWTLHTIPMKGGDPIRLPLFRSARLAYEPQGKRVAINRLERDFRRWKRYAGGTAVQIFIGDLDGGDFRRLTTFKGTNAMPMWHGGRIYFLSDRTGTMNIWSMTPAGQALKQHTRFDDYDVRFPSLGDGKIVFQQRAEIHVFDTASDRVFQVPLKLISDVQRTRTRFTDPMRYLSSMELSPDGSSVGLEIRGNLHLIPAAKEGRRIQVSQGSGVRQWGISFSSDGKAIASISDASDETEVHVFDTERPDASRQLTRTGKPFKYPPRWAPGDKLIAYADSDNRLYVVNPGGGDPSEVDHSDDGRIAEYTWSPDGRYLAYVKPDDNSFNSIFIYDSMTKNSVRVTQPHFFDGSPTWSTDGKYLAFLSERTINPYLDHFDLEAIVDKASKPYLVLLSTNTHSPFLPGALPKETEKKEVQNKNSGPKTDVPQVVVDLEFEGLADRIVEVPVPADNYADLWVGEGVMFFQRWPTLGLADWEEMFFSGSEPSFTLMRFDFKTKKAEPFAEGVVGYDISRDAKKIALRKQKGELYAFELDTKAPEGKALEEKRLPIGEVREPIDPRAEWRQIFNESWRMMRDFFWTPEMGGVDWAAMRKKYGALLPRVATRDELSDLMGEMVAELSLGHTYIWGGDRRAPKPVPVGMLGADLESDTSGRYRFLRIYPGEPWDTKRLSPLTLSHARVKEGDFLLKIDGRDLRVGDNVFSRLQKAAGQIVQLTVAADAGGRDAREVEITTLKHERAVRYHAWVKRNRELIDQKTNSRVGYLHIPDMMTAGMVEFDRWYYPQMHKQGLIVDARWNRGGFVSGIMIKRLARQVLGWSKSRRGRVATYPENTLNGRLVVLTNEQAGSDGDIFPRAVQVAKLGPVIGTRTWGGIVGISLENPLVDRGFSTRPGGFALWDAERRWGVEGEGVEPDIKVDNDPSAVERGVDAQLERGIAEMLKMLQNAPPKPPAFGDPPDKRKQTWVDRYGQTDKP